MTQTNAESANWKNIYLAGGSAAVGAVLVGVAEIAITFLPGGSAGQASVLDWFSLFEQNWFMGLRNLGLLNIFLNLLALVAYFALYGAHRKRHTQPLAAFTTLLAFVGIGVFLATNRAFPMLDLSQQYALATDSTQRAALEAAGQALLVVGASHTPGTFLGFLLADLAGLLMSFVMLRGGVFGKTAAYAGIAGFCMLLLFEIISSFFTGLSAAAMLLAMFGGLLSMAWYILVARRLFQLARIS